jgi:hypothetical protein
MAASGRAMIVGAACSQLLSRVGTGHFQ